MQARILIVDDYKEIRDTLSRHYRLKGYEVKSAENGRIALQLLESEPFQVVISDVLMPVMDGIELLGKIGSEYPMTRVVMISGYVTLENALACLRNGAETFVFKPFKDFVELDDAVKKCFDYLEHWQKKLLFLQEIKSQGAEPV